MADTGGHVGEGDGIEFIVTVLGPAALGLGQRLLQRLDPDMAVQATVRRRAQCGLGDDPQCAERDLGRLENIWLVRGVAIDQIAVWCRQGQGHHIAVDGGQGLARAVGAGAERPAQRLLIDVGQIGHGPPLGGQLWTQGAQTGSSLNDGIVPLPVDNARHLIERDHGPRRHGQRGEGVPGSDHSDRTGRGLKDVGHLFGAGRG